MACGSNQQQSNFSCAWPSRTQTIVGCSVLAVLAGGGAIAGTIFLGGKLGAAVGGIGGFSLNAICWHYCICPCRNGGGQRSPESAHLLAAGNTAGDPDPSSSVNFDSVM